MRNPISHSQFSKVGVSSRSVTSAIDELLTLNLITLTDDTGKSLHDPQQRKRANRIYYALTTQHPAKTTDTTERNNKKPTQISHSTKEIFTKEYNANERIPDQVRMEQINQEQQRKQMQRDNWY